MGRQKNKHNYDEKITELDLKSKNFFGILDLGKFTKLFKCVQIIELPKLLIYPIH